MVQSISPKKLCELHQQNPVDLIDVRTPAEFGDTRASFAETFHSTDSIPRRLWQPKARIAPSLSTSSAKVVGDRAKHAKNFWTQGSKMSSTSRVGRWLGMPLDSLSFAEKKAISVDRQMRIVAGSLVLAGAVLGYFVDPRWIALSGFVGAGLIFAGVTDICPMINVISRMPWNQAPKQNSCSV